MKHARTSAPGSLMLTGEHAVLRGYPALVCAINKRITVEIIPRSDSLFTLSSSLGYFKSTIHSLSTLIANSSDPFQLTLTVLQPFSSHITTGFDLIITSEFPAIGLGSSGALLTALLAALHLSLFKALPPYTDLVEMALSILKTVFGVGSGADIAAALLGNIVYYKKTIEGITMRVSATKSIPLTVIYSGEKVATPIVIKQVDTLQQKNPALFNNLFDSIGKCTELAYNALEHHDLKELGNIFNHQHTLMNRLQVNNHTLQYLIEELLKQTNILGAKISGAGLGDCVIGLGKANLALQGNAKQIPIDMSPNGLLYA